MHEIEKAEKIANMWLEFQMNPLTQMVPGDPDCDACVLARQYIRCHDLVHALQSAVVHTVAGSVEGKPTQTINYLQRLRELVKIEQAAKIVCRYDWSDNDDDAAKTIDNLRALIA